ncbi:MAG TPA: TadE family protein [Microlunatus sp.]
MPSCQPRSRSRRGATSPPRSQRGITESAQFALIWPLLLLVSLGVIQAGIWVHGHNVANRAANVAADAASGSYGSAAEARQIAEGIARSGGLTAVDVQVSTSSTVADVTVAGNAPTLLDLPLGRIHETASAPLERVTRP